MQTNVTNEEEEEKAVCWRLQEVHVSYGEEPFNYLFSSEKRRNYFVTLKRPLKFLHNSRLMYSETVLPFFCVSEMRTYLPLNMPPKKNFCLPSINFWKHKFSMLTWRGKAAICHQWWQIHRIFFSSEERLWGMNGTKKDDFSSMQRNHIFIFNSVLDR